MRQIFPAASFVDCLCSLSSETAKTILGQESTTLESPRYCMHKSVDMKSCRVEQVSCCLQAREAMATVSSGSPLLEKWLAYIKWRQVLAKVWIHARSYIFEIATASCDPFFDSRDRGMDREQA